MAAREKQKKSDFKPRMIISKKVHHTEKCKGVKNHQITIPILSFCRRSA